MRSRPSPAGSPRCLGASFEDQMPTFAAASVVPGTEGYAEDAEWLIPRYESVCVVDKYETVRHWLPARASTVLDIGAGTGLDAAWFAGKGHAVLAVEPTKALREAAARLHRSSRIEWLDDSLPALVETGKTRRRFELILVTAVWGHLAACERRQAMARIAALLEPGARLIMSLRKGPAPPNRRVFEVTAEETMELAQQNGLGVSWHGQAPSVQALNRQAGVTWSWMVFQRDAQTVNRLRAR